MLAVIKLAGSLVLICGKYIRDVKNAKQEILQFRDQIEVLRKVLELLTEYLGDPGYSGCRRNTRKLNDEVNWCRDTLEDLKKKINPGKTKRAMSKVKIRLKWPLNSDEMDETVKSIKDYQLCLNSALQLDQMWAAILEQISTFAIGVCGLLTSVMQRDDEQVGRETQFGQIMNCKRCNV